MWVSLLMRNLAKKFVFCRLARRGLGSILSMGYFPSYFFYCILCDVEVHAKFQHHIIFFCKRIQCFLILKNRFKISSAKCHTKLKFLSQVSHKQGHPHSLMQHSRRFPKRARKKLITCIYIFRCLSQFMPKSGPFGCFWPPDLRHTSSLGQNLDPFFSLVVSISGVTCRES
jgi:hypothetical protein